MNFSSFTRLVNFTTDKYLIRGYIQLPSSEFITYVTAFYKFGILRNIQSFHSSFNGNANIVSTAKIKFLSSLLSCPEYKAETILKQMPDLADQSNQNLLKVVEYLKVSGVNNETIITNNNLLLLKPRNLLKKLKVIEKHNIQLNSNTIHLLLCFPNHKLTIENNWNEAIEFLKKELNLEYNDLIMHLKRHNCLLTMPFERLKTIMWMLKDAGIDSAAIVKDLWVFRHNITLIEERIKHAKSINSPIKPWMLHCTENDFIITMKRWESNIIILGNDDRTAYLSKRLECSRDVILKLLKQNQKVLITNPIKLKKVLDFLFSEGFTSDQICKTPQIFNHNLCKIKQRHNDYKNMGIIPKSLLWYICSYKQHQGRWSKIISLNREKSHQNC